MQYTEAKHKNQIIFLPCLHVPSLLARGARLRPLKKVFGAPPVSNRAHRANSGVIMDLQRARDGGLSIYNIAQTSDAEYSFSSKATSALANASTIKKQTSTKMGMLNMR